MINYGLPVTVQINDAEYKIRADFRAILDILAALNDPDLHEDEKTAVLLEIFYEDAVPPEDREEAVREFVRFLNLGTMPESEKKQPKLMDWEQDFQYIIAPINRVSGRDVRNDTFLHWWSFMGLYNEIGDCLFAQIVSIRDKKARGKKLDKSDSEFYRRNRDIIDIKAKYTAAEESFLEGWLNG